jgi:hypothetical protein
MKGPGHRRSLRHDVPPLLTTTMRIMLAIGTDSYPEWTATLEFEGGGKLELANHRSSLIPIGGPFQMTIGGVTYLQLGPQLTSAVADLVEALGLPLGAPEATTCTHYDFEAAVLK